MTAVQIFLSTVSAEFRRYRDALRRDLDRPNVTVKIQEDFIATGTETLDKLDGYIRQCDAVIHLVGDMTGALAQPPSVAVVRERYPDLATRLPPLAPLLNGADPAISYTQWEAWLALYHKKVLIIAAPEEGALRDDRYVVVEEQQAAQRTHLRRLAAVERYPEIRFANADRLAVEVLRSGLQEILSAAGAARQAVFQAPPMPDRFVPRRDALARMKQRLLATDGESPRVTRALLHGSPGVGKSMLARVFAHDPHIRQRFPDGVIWTELGQLPAGASDGVLTQRLGDWGRALKDPELGPLGYQDPASGTRRLAELLANRAFLLVLDDAWTAAVVRPFLANGPRCLLVVTSRKAEIATDLGMETIRLDEMSPEEGLALMELWAGPIPPREPDTERWLAQQVGHLPLALELIGARVRQLGSWSSYRSRWNKHRLGAVQRRRGASGPLDDLRDSIALSIHDLDDQDRDAYLRMGVFPEDTEFTPGAVAALMGLEREEATELMVDLAAQALLGRRGTGEEIRCRLHDVLHEFAVEHLGESGLAEAHRALVDGYRRACQGCWAEGADDGYYFAQIAYHMRQAGARVELFQLVDPHWMNARHRQSGFDHRGFLEDLAMAIEVAGLAGGDPVAAARVQAARQVVHAEVSLGKPADLAALVYLGRESEAIAQARLDPWGLDRFRGLASVAAALHERGRAIEDILDELAELRTGISGATSAYETARDLIGLYLRSGRNDRAMDLLAQLPDDLAIHVRGQAVEVLAAAGHPQVALDWAAPIPLPVRCGALADVARALQSQDPDQAGALFEEALGIARAVEKDWARAHYLEGLALNLFEAHRFEEGVAACNEIPAEAAFLASFPLMIAGHEAATQGDLETARTVAGLLQPHHKLAVLISCHHRGPPDAPGSQAAYQELLGAAEALPWNERDGLMRYLLRMQLNDAAADLAMRTNDFSDAVSEVAAALAKERSPAAEAVLEHSLALARQNRQATEGMQIRVLGPLAAALVARGDSRAAPLCEYAERHARAATGPHLRAWALLDLGAALLTADSHRGNRLLDEARVEVEREPNENFQWQAIRSAVSTYLESDRLEDALQLVAIRPASGEAILWQMRDEALGKVVTHLVSKGRHEQARAYLTEFRDQKARARYERSLTAPQPVTPRRRAEVTDLIQEVTRPGDLAEAESRAASLPPREQLDPWTTVTRELTAAEDPRARGYLERAFRLAQDLPENRRAPFVTNLVPILARLDGSKEAAAVARRITDGLWKAIALLEVAESESGSAREGLIEEALQESLLPPAHDHSQGEERRMKHGLVNLRHMIRGNEGLLARGLVKLTNALIRLERFAEAHDVIENRMVGVDRGPAARELVSVLAERGSFDAANAMVDLISNDSPDADAAGEAAGALYRKGELYQAIRLLRPPNLDDFLQTLCRWVGQTEVDRLDTAFEVVEAAFTVASWKRPDWKKVRDILARDGAN